MANFDFFINRQGPIGKKGEKGDPGFSPVITVETDTLSEYILRIQTENNTFLTTNLREHKEDLGGTYIRYNRTTGVMYAGDPDSASSSQYGVARFATNTEYENGAEGVITSPDQIKADLANYPTNTALQAALSNYALKNTVVTKDGNEYITGAKEFTVRQFFNSGLFADDVQTPTITNTDPSDLRISASSGHNLRLFTVEGTNGYISLETEDARVRRSGRSYTIVDSGNISNYLPDMNDYYNTTQIDLMLNEKADISDIPTVGNGTITINQGGVQKGQFSLNQSGNLTINLDAGGSSYTNGSGIDITNNEISVKADNNTLIINQSGELEVDTTVIATQSDIPTNYVTTDTMQTISGYKTFETTLNVIGPIISRYSSGSQRAEFIATMNGASIGVYTIDNHSGEIGVTGSGANEKMYIAAPYGSSDLYINNYYDNSATSGIAQTVTISGTNVQTKRNSQTYTIIDSGNIGNHALTSSNISTDTYIQALEARIAALEANINGGSATNA